VAASSMAYASAQSACGLKSVGTRICFAITSGVLRPNYGCSHRRVKNAATAVQITQCFSGHRHEYVPWAVA
jgi:hypothetical protein